MSSQVLDRTVPIDLGLAERLRADPGFRRRFVRRWAQSEVAMQLRSMRQRRKLNQKQLAEKSGTGQSAISRAEQAEYDGWTFKTLVTLAEALDARLRITFEPIEDVIAMYSSNGQFEQIPDTGSVAGAAPFVGAVSMEDIHHEEVPHSLLVLDYTSPTAVSDIAATGGY